MIFEKIVVGIYAENCYLVYDESAPDKDAVIIDPGQEAKRLIDRIDALGLTVRHILLTHGHFDHIGAVVEVRKHTGATLWGHPADLPLIDGAFELDQEIKDGTTFKVGSIRIRAIATPGHTQGGVSFYLPEHKVLFSGDTLFYTSVGRTDLAGGNHKQLIESIQKKLMVLPDDTEVYPGHSVKTTIGFERARNTFLQG